MPKVRKIEDGVSSISALRVTEREGRILKRGRMKLPSIRVRCGCCAENVVIDYDIGNPFPANNTLEINGVLGSIDQWRQVLLPLLSVEPAIPM